MVTEVIWGCKGGEKTGQARVTASEDTRSAMSFKASQHATEAL
jgi:hypothetical protein